MTDIASGALAASTEVSFWHMFWGAHFVVKARDARPARRFGLVLGDHCQQDPCCFAQLKSSMDQFEQIFWSGQSLEELYPRSPTARPPAMAALFVAAMREWKRSFQRPPARPSRACTRASTRCSTSPSRARSSGSKSNLLVLATIALGRTVHRPVRHGVGHHDLVPLDRGLEEHVARGRRARHRRSAVRDRDRPLRRHSGADRLQQAPAATSPSSQARLESFADEFSSILSRQIDQHRRPRQGLREGARRMGMSVGAGARADGAGAACRATARWPTST